MGGRLALPERWPPNRRRDAGAHEKSCPDVPQLQGRQLSRRDGVAPGAQLGARPLLGRLEQSCKSALRTRYARLAARGSYFRIEGLVGGAACSLQFGYRITCSGQQGWWGVVSDQARVLPE